VGASGDSLGGGVAGVMELEGQEGHSHSGSISGLSRGSRGYGAWGTEGIPTQWEQQETHRRWEVTDNR
jgi:hypothetical protein